jgi:hypothetical protein
MLYTFNAYYEARSQRGEPITDNREAFHVYAGPHNVKTLAWWDLKWLAFEALQSRIDERLDGLEATRQDALGGHHEPVAL